MHPTLLSKFEWRFESLDIYLLRIKDTVINTNWLKVIILNLHQTMKHKTYFDLNQRTGDWKPLMFSKKKQHFKL